MIKKCEKNAQNVLTMKDLDGWNTPLKNTST